MLLTKKYFLPESVIAGFLLAVLFEPVFSPVFAAEELQLLTIEGDLIGSIVLPAGADDEAVIDAYYALLAITTRQEIDVHRRRLTRLIPDYEVAYLAADSAELTEVMDEISAHWQEIRSIHAQLFIPDVVDQLDRAYGNVFSVIQQGSVVEN